MALPVAERAKHPVTPLGGSYGHPLHPIFVTVPIGAWIASLVFDIATKTQSAGYPSLVTASEWLIAIGVVGALLAAVLGFLDLLAIPTQCIAGATVQKMATLGEDPDELLQLIRFTSPFDMSGHPTIILPMGFTHDGSPMTFQFVGRPFEEEVLFRAGHAYQADTQWHRQHPQG